MKSKRKAGIYPVMGFFIFIVLVFCPRTEAAGLFGAPQTVSRMTGGLNTAVGFFYHHDSYENGFRREARQNEVYSHAAYGAKNIWEVYARVGASDLKILDAFSSEDADTLTNKNHFRENRNVSGTLGAKAFYPVNAVWGVGAFVQGTYYFSDWKDDVAGTIAGTPFIAGLKIKNLWDVKGGAAFQVTFPRDIRCYAGPYVYYSEGSMAWSADMPGLNDGAVRTYMRNKTLTGAFAGLDFPLTKGFRFNLEGQLADRLSVGAAVSYTY